MKATVHIVFGQVCRFHIIDFLSQGVNETKLKEEKTRLEKEMKEKQRQQQEMIQEKIEEQKKQSEEDSKWLEEEESKSEFPGLLSPVYLLCLLVLCLLFK